MKISLDSRHAAAAHRERKRKIRKLIEYSLGGRPAQVEFAETPQGLKVRITIDGTSRRAASIE